MLAYAFLRFSKKHMLSIKNIFGIVCGGFFGGLLGIMTAGVINLLIYNGATIKITSQVILLLSFIFLMVLIFSYFGLRITEKIYSKK